MIGSRARIVILARPGARICFDCDAQGNGPTRIPGVGTVCLDFSPELVTFVVVIPPSGRFEYEFTVEPAFLTALLGCQVAVLDARAPNNVALSNGICVTGTPDGKCEGCVRQLGYTAELEGGAPTGPVTVVSTLTDQNDVVLGRTTVTYDPARQLTYPVTDNDVVFIDNIARIGGDLFVSSYANGRTLEKGNLAKEIKLVVSVGNRTVSSGQIHTSCSQPIGVGKVFGDFTITALIDCKGNPRSVCKDGKPKVLVMQYTGDDCSALRNSQDPGKTSCSGDPQRAPRVVIRGSNDSDPNAAGARVWFEGLVALGGTFELDAAKLNRDFDSNTWVHVFDEQRKELLQTIQFHTSCSQPLLRKDQFGSVKLVGFRR